jgi:hypothetical protein
VRLRRKEQWKDGFWVFFRKSGAERENRDESRLGWELEWDEKWRKSRRRLFHKAGTVWWKYQFVMFRRELLGRLLSVTREDERVEQSREWRDEGWPITRVKSFINERTLYWILSLILSRWRDSRIRGKWWNLGVLVTARTTAFRTSCRSLVWVEGRFSRI